MIWVAIVGLILTIIGLLARSVTLWNRQPFRDVHDTDRFRIEYEKWEPLVFEQSRTIRATKRFGNRARFLVADHPEDMVSALVGFVALEELGIDNFSKEFSLSEWRQQEWLESTRYRLTERCQSQIRGWMEAITDADVQIYRLLTEGPPTNPHDAGCARLAYCVRLARSSQAAPRPSVLRPIVAICRGPSVPYRLVLASHNTGLELLGVYDSDAARAGILSHRYGIRTFGSVEEAIRMGSDRAVFDISVPYDRLKYIIKELPSRSSIVLRRPPGVTRRQVSAIHGLCRRKRLTVSIDNPLRYVSLIVGASELVRRGLIGDVEYMDVRIDVNTVWHRWAEIEGRLPRGDMLYCSGIGVELVRSVMGNPDDISLNRVCSRIDSKALTRVETRLMYRMAQHATVCATHWHHYSASLPRISFSLSGSRGSMVVALDHSFVIRYEVITSDGTDVNQTFRIDASRISECFSGTILDLMCYLGKDAPVLSGSLEEFRQTMEWIDTR